MNLDTLRAFCLSLPHVGEKMQWGDHILFTIGGKMFCISTVEPTSPTKLSFKCTPDTFAELVERPDIIPAPYMARNYWVSLTEWDAIPTPELRTLIRDSYNLVASKLPKKIRIQFGLANPSTPPTAKPSSKARA